MWSDLKIIKIAKTKWSKSASAVLKPIWLPSRHIGTDKAVRCPIVHILLYIYLHVGADKRYEDTRIAISTNSWAFIGTKGMILRYEAHILLLYYCTVTFFKSKSFRDRDKDFFSEPVIDALKKMGKVTIPRSLQTRSHTLPGAHSTQRPQGRGVSLVCSKDIADIIVGNL